MTQKLPNDSVLVIFPPLPLVENNHIGTSLLLLLQENFHCVGGNGIVTVNKQHPLTHCLIKQTIARGCHTMIRLTVHLNAMVFLGQFFHQFPGAIGRTVINDDDLQVGITLCNDRANTLPQALGSVIYRYQNRYPGGIVINIHNQWDASHRRWASSKLFNKDSAAARPLK